jgi:signal transduction histidine kinase
MDTAVSVSERVPAGRDLRQVGLVAIMLAGAVATAVAAELAYAGAESRPGLPAFAHVLSVGVPIAVGLYAWYRRENRRFGILLMAAGAGWFVTTLAESDSALAYTIGRTAGWLVEILIVYLLLAFPSGRLRGRIDRQLVRAMAAAVLVLFLPQLLLAETFSVPSPFTSCVRDCPGNVLFVLDAQPGFVSGVMRPLGAVLVFAVMIGVLLRLRGTVRESTLLTRMMMAPVFAIAMVLAGALGVAIVGRELEPDAWPIEAAAWFLALTVPAIALAFLVGLLRWRLYGERALRRLAACLRSMPDAMTLRRAFAEAFGDPTIEIVFPADDRWTDCRGRTVDLPPADSGRAISEVRQNGVVVAAIAHDEGLRQRPELLEAGVSMAAVVLENQRLVAEAEVSLRELQESRARIASGAEQERRRIERDLHDGAQQRLVALRIELELAEDAVRAGPEVGVARLRKLEHDVEEALDELRDLAHGVYPPVLADRGLEQALRAVALGSTVRVDLVTHDIRRFPTEVEGAVYFCIREALQNVQKHATGAHRVVIRLDAGTHRELRFSVRDDGAGTPLIMEGAGMTNMRDRLAAIGGYVDVASRPGVGTVVRGRVPTG